VSTEAWLSAPNAKHGLVVICTTYTRLNPVVKLQVMHTTHHMRVRRAIWFMLTKAGFAWQVTIVTTANSLSVCPLFAF